MPAAAAAAAAVVCLSLPLGPGTSVDSRLLGQISPQMGNQQVAGNCSQPQPPEKATCSHMGCCKTGLKSFSFCKTPSMAIFKDEDVYLTAEYVGISGERILYFAGIHRGASCCRVLNFCLKSSFRYTTEVQRRIASNCSDSPPLSY